MVLEHALSIRVTLECDQGLELMSKVEHLVLIAEMYVTMVAVDNPL